MNKVIVFNDFTNEFPLEDLTLLAKPVTFDTVNKKFCEFSFNNFICNEKKKFGKKHCKLKTDNEKVIPLKLYQTVVH